MRLTIQLIEQSPQYINAFKQRELDLRSHRIAIIENMGATKDVFDSIDLSENTIQILDGFSRLASLKYLYLSHNEISSISPSIHLSLPNLETLNLMNNKIQSFTQIQHLSQCSKLTHLVLKDNPIYKLQGYRVQVIHFLPQLKFLDHMKVTTEERDRSKGTFEPGIKSTQEKKLTNEEKKKIIQLIKQATTLAEANRLEACLRENRMP